MTIDQLADRAATELRDATRQAEFTVTAPGSGQLRRRVAVVAAVALLAVVMGGTALLMDGDGAGDVASGTSEFPVLTLDTAATASPDSAPSATSEAPSTVTTMAPPLPEAQAWSGSEGDFYDWLTVANGPDGVRAAGTEPQLLGVRRVLASVEQSVPVIEDSTVLMYGSTDFFEEAFFVMEDGTDTMIYIGWQDVAEGVFVKLPIADGMVTEQWWGEATVARRTTSRMGDFVVEMPQALATVRFFALDDEYGISPIATSEDEMVEIARAVFEAMGFGTAP
jgi:hypothetical protein